MKSSSSTTTSSAIRTCSAAVSRFGRVAETSTDRPFSFYTEASIDLADRPELLAAMVEANFMYVFIGIETPSAEALKESKKFQNLRKDNLQQIRVIQESGLWVLGGFIVGFDSDDETIFERQREFIERTAITWAMAGVLQAPPTHRLLRPDETRRPADRRQPGTRTSARRTSDTMLPLPVLLRGLSRLLFDLYTPKPFSSARFVRWSSGSPPHAAAAGSPLSYNLRLLVRSIWTQGVRSSVSSRLLEIPGPTFCATIRRARQALDGLHDSSAGHHFLIYAHEVADELARSIRTADDTISLTSESAATALPG